MVGIYNYLCPAAFVNATQQLDLLFLLYFPTE